MHRGGVRRYVSDLAATWPIDDRRWSQREATVVVADVCGFTRLSERLAPFGAEGTEAVKGIINSTLEPCLDCALRAGGDVIKFAGDGFLTMFDGDEHPARAARAAAEMQRAVQALEPLQTPAGRIRPRITVGAETGKLAALVLDDPEGGRRDVVTTGEVVDAAFALDSMATAGQVRVGGALADALPGAWSRRLPGSTARRLNLAAIPPVARGLVPSSRPDGWARQFLDPAIAEVALHGVSLAEHRTIGVAFVVIDDIDSMWSDSSAAALTDWLGEVAETTAAACRRHEVCWLESDSEQGRVRLLLTVGAPARRENDTERLVDAVREIAVVHPIRAGVARGRAFVGDIGHEERRAYNVMGPVVNLAARLAAIARPASTVLTAEVAELVGRSFDTKAAAPVTLKGFATPVEIAELAGRRSRPLDTATSSPLWGRDSELKLVLGRIRFLNQGAGSALDLVAGAGVGKSRFIEHVESEAGVDSFRAAGQRDRQATPYAALAPLLRAALGVPLDAPPDVAGVMLLERLASSAPDLRPVAPLIATATHAAVPDTETADAVDRRFRGPRTREVVIELLATVRAEPTLYVAEDVHWFDDASHLLLTALGAAAPGRPWLVVATRRPGAIGLDGFETHVLEPLDAAAIRRIALDTIGDAPVTRRQIDEIVTASSGNPLFAQELAKSAGSVKSAARAGRASLPDRIDEIIATRIDDLDLDSRLILRDLSVAGIEVDGTTVQMVLEERGMGDEGLLLLREFVAVDAGGVRFRHDLYRRAAYEGLSVRRRRELHSRMAKILAGRPDAAGLAAAIAEHAHHAQDAQATWLWARTAAADALAKGASHETAVNLQRALAAVGALDVSAFEVARVAETLGDALELGGRPDEAHAAYRRARRAVSDDPLAVARLCRKHARVDQRAGRYGASLRWSTRGLKLVGDDDAAAAELRLVAGVVRFFQGRFDQAIALASEAASIADRRSAISTLAQAHLQLEMTYSELGRKDERARHGARALHLLEQLDDRLGLANLHLNLGVSQYNEANWTEAIAHYQRSAEYFRMVGDTIGAEAARNNQAEILTDQGRLDEANAILQEVERALRAAQYSLGIAMTQSGRARIALRLGDAGAAETLLRAARSAFDNLGARHMIVDTDVRRVEHLVWTSRLGDADRLADQVAHELDEIGPVAVLPATLARLRGWAAIRCGRDGEAASLFRRGLELAREEGFDYEVALALDALIASRSCTVTEAERRRLVQLMDDLDIADTPRPPWLTTL